MNWLRPIIGCAGVALAIAPAAHAQAPALYWTHFEMGAPAHCGGVKWCATVAFGELSKEGFNPKRDGTVGAFGSNRDSTVVVHCTAIGDGKMSAGVFAAAASAPTAEAVRDKIKQKMQGARCL